MKNSAAMVFIAAFIIASCEKELPFKPEFVYDCYHKNVAYSEDGEFKYRFNSYYLGGLIIRRDCSPGYILNWEYDQRGNNTRFESDEGRYFLYSYDAYDNRVQSKQFVEDTLYSTTELEYTDTLLLKELYYNHLGELSNTTDYFYDAVNRLDSAISNTRHVYHQYPANQHRITIEDKNGIKVSEEITTIENGLMTKYEEYFYRDLELIRSHIYSKEYNEDNQLVKSILKKFQEGIVSFPSYPDYVETRYYYNGSGDIIRTESYDDESLRFEYVEYLYDSGSLVKKQSYDNDGNKTGYVIIENTCN